MSKFKFIDLFSGIGAFHIALEELGGKCVFASEINDECVETYKINFGMNSKCDITQLDEKNIPKHDVLCAGFPCQAFSKAGKQGGINDARGTLFFDVARILKFHKTKYILLENVRNLVAHDGGKTWRTIKSILHSLGYRLTEEPLILSPHQFGVPQYRERVFILGKYEPENVDEPLKIELPHLMEKSDNNIYEILEPNSISNLSDYENYVLEVWNDFYEIVKSEKSLGFPIRTYYFKNSYRDDMPDWKINYIEKNNALYNRHKHEIDAWLKKYNNLSRLNPTHRKFEWQAGKDINSIYEGIIQFRPSGVRVKRPDIFPALVAIVQTPIIGRFKRKLSLRECARLQSFPDSFKIVSPKLSAYKQFGNSANVKIIKTLCEILLKL